MTTTQPMRYFHLLVQEQLGATICVLLLISLERLIAASLQLHAFRTRHTGRPVHHYHSHHCFTTPSQHSQPQRQNAIVNASPPSPYCCGISRSMFVFTNLPTARPKLTFPSPLQPHVPQYNPGTGSQNSQSEPPSGLSGGSSPPAPPSETTSGPGGGWGTGAGPSGVFSGGSGAAPTATGWGSGRATSAPGPSGSSSGSGYAPFPMISGLPMASSSAAAAGGPSRSGSPSGMVSSYRPAPSATGAASASTTSTASATSAVVTSGANAVVGMSGWRAGGCGMAVALAGVGAGFVLFL